MHKFYNTRLFKRTISILHTFLPTNFAILNLNPLIILTSYRAERAFPFYIMYKLAAHFVDQDIHFICYVCGYLPEGDLFRLKKHERQHDRNGRIYFHFMTNTAEQHEQILEIGFPSVQCSSNALIDENIFIPMNLPKRWDAIYDAQLHPCKRHYLATNISSLGLIFSKVPWTLKSYACATLHKLPLAELLNNKKDGSYTSLNADEVATLINQARVGLCLSAQEGAMYACIQYLLVGIPVVTTNNRGGRNEFLDSENSIYVDDNPRDTLLGVEQIMKKNLDSATIRKNVLKKIWCHRQRLFIYIESLLPPESKGNFSKTWSTIFFNKLTIPHITAGKMAQLIKLSLKTGLIRNMPEPTNPLADY